jgi:hypothetical protein
MAIAKKAAKADAKRKQEIKERIAFREKVKKEIEEELKKEIEEELKALKEEKDEKDLRIAELTLDCFFQGTAK